jgi:hypothetical protein
MAAERRCVWLYAVTADGAEPPGDSVTGIGAGPVRAVSAAGLTAIVGDVDERDFGEAALRGNLEDLDWLDRTARAHHAVIEAMAGQGAVVPMRLATVYSGDAGVAETLRQREEDLREALARVSGRSEWGVKAYAAEPDDPDPATADQSDGPGGAASPGTAYLRRRREQLSARADARAQATAAARAIHAELERIAVCARLYPPQSPELAGPSAMVLNAAYLVADERADELAGAVVGLTARRPAVRLTLTGPWPAYSFAGGTEEK